MPASIAKFIKAIYRSGYLFLRIFGNLGTCLEISEKLGSLPNFPEISEEFYWMAFFGG
jgi:hypothetical protein